VIIRPAIENQDGLDFRTFTPRKNNNLEGRKDRKPARNK
jgi:hypothetical protein